MANDRAVAEEIAEAVRRAEAESKRRSWRRVTTLLAAFGLYNLTDAARSRIDHALAEAGLVVEPPLAIVERSGGVRLSSVEASSRPAEEAPGRLPAGVTAWKLAAAGFTEADLRRPPTPRAPIVVDVIRGQAYSETLHSTLLRLLPGLTPEALTDVLEADLGASFKRADAQGQRLAGVYVSLPSGDAADGAVAVEVRRALIELAVAPAWLLVVRHMAEVIIDGATTGDGDVPPAAAYFQQLESFGLSAALEPLAAAMVVLEHAVHSFSELEADLASRLESWRLAFAREPNPERRLLVGLQGSLSGVTKSLRPLRHPSALAWAGVAHDQRAKDVRDDVERSLEALQGLGSATAAALVVVDQLSAEEHRQRAEQHQLQLAEYGAKASSEVVHRPGVGTAARYP